MHQGVSRRHQVKPALFILPHPLGTTNPVKLAMPGRIGRHVREAPQYLLTCGQQLAGIMQGTPAWSTSKVAKHEATALQTLRVAHESYADTACRMATFHKAQHCTTVPAMPTLILPRKSNNTLSPHGIQFNTIGHLLNNAHLCRRLCC